MKIDKLWSDDEVARLISLVRDRTIAQAAAQLGRRLGSVQGKITELRRHGVTVITRGTGQPSNGVPLTAEHAEWLRHAVTARKSDKEMAAHLGVSISAVYDRLKKLGLDGHRFRVWSEQEEAQLRAMAGKMSAKEIAAIVGRSTWAVRGHAKQLRISVRVPVAAKAKPSRQPRPARVSRVKDPAPAAPKPQRVPAKRHSRYRYVGTVDYCTQCRAPFVNTVEGWAGHRERLGHSPIGRAA